MKHQYITRGTCARQIEFELEGNIIRSVSFNGGCNGNLKAIAKLVEGQTVEHIEELLLGNTCGMKSTSCADQLSIALKKAMAE